MLSNPILDPWHKLGFICRDDPSDYPAICGHDDTGRVYASLDELWSVQQEQRAAFYSANRLWWEDGGYNGSTDEAAMIGDENSEADTEESGRFLDGLLNARWDRHPEVHGRQS